MDQPFAPDKSKSNYLQRCYYVINLMKDKDFELWENFHGQYCATKPEESWELFQMVVEEYRKLITPAKKVLKMPKKKAAPRKSAARKAA